MITPQEVMQFTPLGGNIDIDKIKPVIFDAQVTVIEPLLGTNLYNKIVADFEADTLAGSYLILYDNYLKPILRHQIFAEYVEIGSYVVDNGGIFKHQPADSVVVEKGEVQYLAQTQRAKAQMYVQRAERYLCIANIPEYAEYTALNNKVHNVKLSGGWHLGSRKRLNNDSLEY